MVVIGRGILTNSSGWTSEKWASEVDRLKDSLYPWEDLSLSCLPYSIRKKLETVVEKQWALWEPKIAPLFKSPLNAKSFISTIASLESHLKMGHFLFIAYQIDKGAIRGCLFDEKIPLERRKDLDSDLSKGLMRDLSEEALIEIGNGIEKSSSDWRLLADAFGFNYEECLSFPSSLDILKIWVKKKPSATLARLEFEVKRLDMKEAVEVLKGIPLEGAPLIEVEIIDSFLLDRLTRFQLKRIEQISKGKGKKIPWHRLAFSLCPYAATNNPTIPPFEILWRSNYVKCSSFLSFLKTFPGLNVIGIAFQKEMETTAFKHENKGGILLKQIGYLGLMTYQKYRKRKNREEESDPVDMKNLQTFVFGKISLGTPINFLNFLLYCWQDPKIGEECNLSSFCDKMVSFLETAQDKKGRKACKNKTFIQCFRESYLEINPWRHFLPKWAKTLREKAALQKIEKISSERLFLESCTICLDKPREYIAIPCGHFDFCLDCIQLIQNCSSCRAPIENRVKVFKT